MRTIGVVASLGTAAALARPISGLIRGALNVASQAPIETAAVATVALAATVIGGAALRRRANPTE